MAKDPPHEPRSGIRPDIDAARGGLRRRPNGYFDRGGSVISRRRRSIDSLTSIYGADRSASRLCGMPAFVSGNGETSQMIALAADKLDGKRAFRHGAIAGALEQALGLRVILGRPTIGAADRRLSSRCAPPHASANASGAAAARRLWRPIKRRYGDDMAGPNGQARRPSTSCIGR